jgi:hypothetical protein
LILCADGLFRGLAALVGVIEELERLLPLVMARREGGRRPSEQSCASTSSPPPWLETEALTEMAAFVRGCLEAANATMSGRRARRRRSMRGG